MARAARTGRADLDMIDQAEKPERMQRNRMMTFEVTDDSVIEKLLRKLAGQFADSARIGAGRRACRQYRGRHLIDGIDQRLHRLDQGCSIGTDQYTIGIDRGADADVEGRQQIGDGFNCTGEARLRIEGRRHLEAQLPDQAVEIFRSEIVLEAGQRAAEFKGDDFERAGLSCHGDHSSLRVPPRWPRA